MFAIRDFPLSFDFRTAISWLDFFSIASFNSTVHRETRRSSPSNSRTKRNKKASAVDDSFSRDETDLSEVMCIKFSMSRLLSNLLAWNARSITCFPSLAALITAELWISAESSQDERSCKIWTTRKYALNYYSRLRWPQAQVLPSGIWIAFQDKHS